jgi:hypothetical protein
MGRNIYLFRSIIPIFFLSGHSLYIWVALGRWVAKLIARLLATAALWVQIQTSLKNAKMGDISKVLANRL